MYEVPVLFPQVTNRESWKQTIQAADDDTGELISLVDGNNNLLYTITIEIVVASARGHDGWNWPIGTPYYDYGGTPIITSTVAGGSPNPPATSQLSVVDTGTIQIFIPKAVWQTLHANKTYDVYMTIYEADIDDGRQLFVGRIPVLYGGRTT